jgi:hypothetical protein
MEVSVQEILQLDAAQLSSLQIALIIKQLYAT